MSHTEALMLVDEMLARGETVTQYARRTGQRASTVQSRAHRAGVRLGVELRRRRVQQVFAMKARHPLFSLYRAALECGWSSGQSFCRARRSLTRWASQPSGAPQP